MPEANIANCRDFCRAACSFCVVKPTAKYATLLPHMCEDTPLRYAPPLQVCETTELGKLSVTDSVEKYSCSIVRDDVRVQPKVKLYGAASIGHSNYACLFATHTQCTHL